AAGAFGLDVSGVLALAATVVRRVSGIIDQVRIGVGGCQAELLRQGMFETHLQRVVVGVRSIALHANPRKVGIRAPGLNVARTWFGLIPVVPETGIHVS